MLTDGDFHDIVEQFPHIEFGFAYGSGVVKQEGYDYKVEMLKDVENNEETKFEKELPMVDMIFAVPDPVAWHEKNMELNPTHYTPMVPTVFLTPEGISYVQDAYRAHMWYNAMIPMNISRFPNRLMKYGVISKNRLLEDLNNWTTLYAAGRLHKPVRIIKTGTDTEIKEGLRVNRLHAVRTSLMLMPHTFDEFNLYYTIASLSYVGDPRMLMGENPMKVMNLVRPVVPQYKSLYAKTLLKVSEEVGLTRRVTDGKTTFTLDHCARMKLAQALPYSLRRHLNINRIKSGRKSAASSAVIRAALAAVVAKAATGQSIKGMFTVGVVKGCTYAFNKMKKRLFPMMKTA